MPIATAMFPQPSRASVGKTAIALAVSALAGAHALAQTLEGVVVTATRAEQRSFDAPAAIESVDRDTIQNAGPQVNLSE